MEKAVSFILALVIVISPLVVFATESVNKYYFDDCEFYNAGKNTGYSEKKEIDKNDPHFGWDLGGFYATGYTDTVTNTDGSPIFLKNVGDKISLKFHLDQDIQKLNGNENLTIASDIRGYNKYYGVEQQVFGYGTLIYKCTDYQNKQSKPIVYTHYLKGVKKGADTDVVVFEEGDYEAVLNYKIKNNPRQIKGISIVPTYTDYSMSFKFSVRNGNCMVYPFDVKSGSELKNTSITENGFYLDFANSRYLSINVKREIKTNGAAGLTEDIRFNRPAKDGEEYTEEGIYTITATNKYTKQETTKVIYVGNDAILKAYVTTGLSLSEINAMVEQGATINSDGSIMLNGVTVKESTIESESETTVAENEEKESSPIKSVIIGVCILVLVIAIVVIAKRSKSKKAVEAGSEIVKNQDVNDR